jgi:hypothetical protein
MSSVLERELVMSPERTAPVEFPPRVVQYGKDEPLPERHEVRAGPLTAILEGGDLRYVKLGADQVVLRLYAAIRDRNWNTIEPRYLEYHLEQGDDSFSLRFVAENVGNDVNYEWTGTIAGSADGVITATMDGHARQDFLKNRIGWCVLHPMDLAGAPATVETPNGAVSGAFPDLISPHQPFIDMESILHGTSGGGEVVIRFAGDLFEMEDQRNWTDASYKTYSTPLRMPYPAPIKQADRVWQRVTIAATGGEVAKTSTLPLRVEVDPTRSRPLPLIGIGAAGHGVPLGGQDAKLLQALQPAHLRVTLDLTVPNWRSRLAGAGADAATLGSALEIEAVVSTTGAGIDELADALTTAGVDIARVFVFPDDGMTTTETVIDSAIEAFQQRGIVTLLGGGSRAYFTELNRATLPLAAMEVVGYTVNPQVHAFDNASLTESLAAQAETVRSARAIVGDRPLAVGPITLSPRFNPNASGPETEPDSGALPAAVDYRQPSLFAAGWLTGSINALANAGADALTYFETTGWRGLIERRDHPLRVAAFHSWPGMVFPIYHVLADVADFALGDVLPLTLSDPLRVQALALRDGERVRVLLANMSDAPTSVELSLPGAVSGSMRSLATESAIVAASDPATFRSTTRPLSETTSPLTIELPPYGVTTLDLEVSQA